MKRIQRGFTLIEIAIVLVIIGLLLGGVLKGQEFITSARVRNLIQQQDGVKAAYFGFLDRFRALPGDYSAAVANMAASKNGDGDGQIEATNGTDAEMILAWEHLSKAGFINGSYTYAATATDASNAKNPYGGYLQLVYDGIYGTGVTATPMALRHNLKTGVGIPSEILAEIDRKVDDGLPYTGAFQSSLGQSAATDCISATPFTWVAGKTNCNGASLY